MRILLLCASDLSSCINLNFLVPELAKKHTVSVILSDQELPNERGHRFADTKIWYEKDFVQQHLFPAIDAFGESDAPWLTFKGLADRYELDCFPLPKGRVFKAMCDHTQAFAPDALFCCRFDYILREDVFLVPPLGAYNMHSGLLPQCAGAEATFWAMYNDWELSGCTVHAISKDIDKGNIVGKKTFALDYSYGILWNRTKAYAKGAELIKGLVQKLEHGQKPVGETQDLKDYAYYPFPDEEHFATLCAKQKGLHEAHGYASLVQPFLPSKMHMPSFVPPWERCD